MTIDERLAAVTINLELVSHDIETLRDSMTTLRDVAKQDGENIRALARIAEIHERRLTDLEEQ